MTGADAGTVGRLRALLEAAAPLPWIRSGFGYNILADGGRGHSVSVRPGGQSGYDPLPDAALIVAAVNALPDLLAVADAARGIDAVVVNDAVWTCDCPSCVRHQRLRNALTALGRRADGERE